MRKVPIQKLQLEVPVCSQLKVTKISLNKFHMEEEWIGKSPQRFRGGKLCPGPLPRP